MDDLYLYSRSRFLGEITHFDVHFLANFSISLGEIQYDATTCWFVQAHAILIFHVIFKGEKSADVMSWNRCLKSSCVRTLGNHFVSNLV